VFFARINSWWSVATSTYMPGGPQDLEEEEKDEGEELPDAEALQRKRLREAEEWRLQQLRSGEADDNANFQVSSLLGTAVQTGSYSAPRRAGSASAFAVA
jgi:hypothetical protein